MIARRLSIAGQRFGSLVAVELIRSTQRGHAIWSFLCDCGEAVQCRGSRVVAADRAGKTLLCANCAPPGTRAKGVGALKFSRRSHGAHEPRRKRDICPLCYGLPHRVDGPACSRCGLRGETLTR